MRRLTQPGPVHPVRSDSFQGGPVALRYALQQGRTLNEALTAPLVAAGLRGGTIRFGGGTLSPFRYVMPGPPDGPAHVAYFTAPHTPDGVTTVEVANATFGWDGERPTVHIHGAWRQQDGKRRGGHMLPQECIVASEMPVQAWGFANVRVATAADAETNFTLLQPSGESIAGARGVFARIRPNEDLCLATEAIARQHGIRNAVVRGSMGSLIGARFADGRAVEDYATEVMVREGSLRDGIASFTMVVADMQGNVHEGLLARGDNPVLITFDLVLESLD